MFLLHKCLADANFANFLRDALSVENIPQPATSSDTYASASFIASFPFKY
jgi:hypothetical protein